MPKKIKEKNDTVLKGNKEPLLNANNIHILFGIIGVVALLIVVSVGVFVYLEDRYHEHKDNPIVEFQYNETVERGYNNFAITEMNNKQVCIEFVSISEQDVKNISRKKYLDFNEEIYRTGLLDHMLEGEAVVTNNDWNIYIRLADGTRKYLYSAALPSAGTEQEEYDLTQVRQIIEKYTGHECYYLDNESNSHN